VAATGACVLPSPQENTTILGPQLASIFLHLQLYGLCGSVRAKSSRSRGLL